jgi:anti-sigma regulatory factor (Ser/Thr protein kinase)
MKESAHMTMELHASPEEVMRAVESLREFAEAKGIPERTIFGLALALEECGSNIVNHALQRDARQKFQVALDHTGEIFVIELRDRGPEFDPTIIPEGKPQAEDEDPLGGWGIQLVRRYTDEIRYVRAGEENILRLTKRLNGPVISP